MSWKRTLRDLVEIIFIISAVSIALSLLFVENNLFAGSLLLLALWIALEVEKIRKHVRGEDDDE